jgi:hypothetical protein
MAATRSVRRSSRRTHGVRKSSRAGRVRHAKPVRPAAKAPVRGGITRVAAAPLPPVLYRLCKSGWGVIVDRTPNAQGTRFVCPFCPVSHRVPGPVRGFRKMRRPQWLKLRKVEE